MDEGRSKKALRNTISAFIMEFVSVISGLILPRMILSNFGSEYNGITSSITHFISFITLMKAGIGGVTRAALYKPIAEQDSKGISEVLYETEKYIRKVACIFLGLVLVFAVGYASLEDEFSWLFTFSLVLIISIPTFIEYYFCYARGVLLEADQKISIWNIAQVSVTVLSTVIAVCLIKTGASIHLVKLGSAAAYMISPIIIYYYTNRHYDIDRRARPKETRLSQRWDALAHELADFVNSNVDVITLTLFTNLKEVSVYTIYAYVTTSIRKVVLNTVAGFNATFGNMYAQKEYTLMNENLGIYELIVFSTTSIIYSVALVMIAPFAILYTNGVVDVNYNRPLFGALLVLANMFTCFRIPYNTITTVAGHFRQTKKIAYCEAFLNVVVSVGSVLKWGLVGVTFGTLVAAIFRSFMYAYYMGKNVLPRKLRYFLIHVFVAMIIVALVFLSGTVIIPTVTTIGQWILKATIMTMLSIALTLLSDCVIWREDTFRLVSKLFKSIR